MQNPDMKVLGLVSFRIYPTLMGGQKGVAVYYHYLKEHLDVMLAVSKDNEDPGTIRMEKILHPNKKIFLNIFRTGKLLQLVRREKPRLLMAEHSYSAWLAWWLHKKTGLPFIIHSHNIESRRFHQMHHWWWKLYEVYEGWIHRRAQHSFFISEEDRSFAVSRFRLDPAKCTVVTYGVEKFQAHLDKTALRKKLGLDPDKTIFLFNGTLDYKPNYDAVITLIEKLEPLFSQQLDNYGIIITGNRASQELTARIRNSRHVRYAGYVDDVNDYYQCADLFINPVANDTGVKTKVIEAIANHCTVVSTSSGASGINRKVCGQKLHTVTDGDWEAFAKRSVQLAKTEPGQTPDDFFDYYEWNSIAKKSAALIKQYMDGSKA